MLLILLQILSIKQNYKQIKKNKNKKQKRQGVS